MTSHTILIVEDDPDIALSLRDVLEDEGYGVVTASNGKEGLERLREMAQPCLILLDLMMPVMSGGEFLAAVRRGDGVVADVPIVIVSAWPKEAAQVLDQTQGFVQKPVSLPTLLAVADQFCGAHRSPQT